MAAVRPPIYVVDRMVNTGYHANGEPAGRGWWEIPCASRKAYGCGGDSDIQEVVDGLILYARLGDDGPLLASSLAIRLSDAARRRFKSELQIDPDGPFADDYAAYAVVEVAEEEGVTTIVLSVRRRSIRARRPLTYYLVYDATDRSLSVFQIRREEDEGVCTKKPIVPKRTSGGGDYKLLFLGQGDEDHRSSSDDYKNVFWVGSLSASSDGGSGAVMSKLKSMDFPLGLIHKPFNVDVAFSFQGKCFWGDLEQGLVYCESATCRPRILASSSFPASAWLMWKLMTFLSR